MEVRGGGLEALGGEVLLWQALCREHQPCQREPGNWEHQGNVGMRDLENQEWGTWEHPNGNEKWGTGIISSRENN